MAVPISARAKSVYDVRNSGRMASIFYYLIFVCLLVFTTDYSAKCLLRRPVQRMQF